MILNDTYSHGLNKERDDTLNFQQSLVVVDGWQSFTNKCDSTLAH